MSLCYDFQKWSIISIVSVAISLTIGLIILVADAYAETYRNTRTNEIYTFNGNYSVEDYERLVDYCFNHSEEVLAGKNVIQELANSGLIPQWFGNKTCLNVQDETEDARAFSRMLIEYREYLRKIP